jgi:hypothetical protein
LNISDYFSTAEHASYNYLVHVPLFVADSTDNGKVFTDQKMFLFKKWFDREIPLTNAEVIEPALGQILLEGVKLVSLESLPEKFDQNNKQVFKNKINEIAESAGLFDPDSLRSVINEFIIESDEIKTICDKIIKLIPSDGIMMPGNDKKVDELEKLLFINEKRTKIAKIISSSAQDILLSISENIEYNEDSKRSGWIKTKLLHQSIADLTAFFNKCFSKLLKLF